MGKLYTLDEKLLVGRPEVRIGDKIFAVDDRKKTFEKLEKLIKEDQESIAAIDKALQMLLGSAACKQIEEMELSFNAYQALFSLVMDAVTGAEPEQTGEGQQSERFQKNKG